MNRLGLLDPGRIGLGIRIYFQQHMMDRSWRWCGLIRSIRRERRGKLFERGRFADLGIQIDSIGLSDIRYSHFYSDSVYRPTPIVSGLALSLTAPILEA